MLTVKCWCQQQWW